MNILSESLLSNTQEQCRNCECYEMEFAVLKKKLALSYASITWLENLETIRGQMQSIQTIAKENKIGLQDLAAGLNYSLDKLFSCKNKEIVDRGKKVIDLIFELFNKISENSILQKEKSMRKEQSPKKSEVEVEEKTQKKENYGRYEIKRQPLRQQQERKTQRYEQLQEYSNSSRDKKQESMVEKDSFSVVQSSHNESNSRPNKNYSYDDICLPLIWEETSQFNNNGKTITKLHDSDYKKIGTQMPLPSTGIHKLKFQMVNAGTVAFGIVPKGLKHGKFYDNKKAIKYLSFENGGGLVKECNDQIVEGKKVHIAEGEILEIVYKADQRKLVYRNKKMGEVVVEIQKHPIFKNKEVYFFLQMKQENTKIKIL